MVYPRCVVLKSLLPYAELQVTTNFSFLRGASHPQEYVERAMELGYRALAITDLNNLAGIVRAHGAAKEVGLPLIIGCRVQPYFLLLSDKEIDHESNLLPFSLLLHATDKASYQRLSALLTKGKLRAEKGRCFLTIDDMAEYSEGLLATAAIHDFSHPQLEKLLLKLQQFFPPERLSLALRSTYEPNDRRYQLLTAELSSTLGIDLVATNDVHYHLAERRRLQDALTCIRLGCTIEAAGFKLFGNAERHLKSIAEINHLFRRFPDAIRRSVELAERCTFSLDELQYEYPREICPDEKTPPEYLRELVIQGCREVYPQGLPKSVAMQIKHELELIRELDYEKYFLTVHDIVRFAKSRQILCQGRGAAANSAVCYVLGITAVDPAQIPLFVERFISKERNEPPDIDIDFEHERREEVIQYIYRKYGRLRAALTAEVISYRTRSSLRDIGKVFGLTIDEIELLIKIKTRSGDYSISEARLTECGLDPNDRNVRHTIELAEVLRSFPRHLSQHVGGFVISDPPLSEIVPIENAAMPDRSTIEWDKDDIEQLGMLKIDVLGLGMLTCIRKAFEFVNTEIEKEPGHQGLRYPLNLYSLPREDPKVYDMICRADTIGVFQIESRAQMSMLPRLRPRCFYDLVVEVAIVRPGPIQGGMVHPYLRRRQGLEPVSYPDERIKSILHRTLGVPIFQEQVMELSVVAAGFTPGESDQLRRAMASWKKDANALLKFEHKLKNGMRENGYSEEFAKQVFEQIKGFGEYGFPQSHSASFALLVYASAWLKCHYPAHFAAGLINSLPMGFYQPAQIVQDAKNHGVEVREVDVNYSNWDCTLEGKKVLRLGMRLVRGLREEQAEKIAKAVKTQGRFNSVVALWRAGRVRVDTLRHLAAADAFRSMGLDRQQVLWEIKKLRDERLPLFEGREDREEPVKLPALGEQLHVLRDYRSVGLSLKAHPMSFIRGILDRHRVKTIEEFKIAPNRSKIAVAGMVLLRQAPGTAHGTVFMTVEDETGMANAIIWPTVRDRFRDSILDSTFLVISGKVQRESDVLNLIAEEFLDISSYYADMESFSRDFR